MKNNLDKHTGSAVFVGQAAFKPRVYGRNRTEMAVFLRPQHERTVGWARLYNTLLGKSLRRFHRRFEATRQPSICLLQKLWSHTMQTVNVSDAVSDCAYVLSFLEAAFSTISNNRDQITLTHDERTGVGLILSGISQRLFASADALSNKQTTLEV